MHPPPMLFFAGPPWPGVALLLLAVAPGLGVSHLVLADCCPPPFCGEPGGTATTPNAGERMVLSRGWAGEREVRVFGDDFRVVVQKGLLVA